MAPCGWRAQDGRADHVNAIRRLRSDNPLFVLRLHAGESRQRLGHADRTCRSSVVTAASNIAVVSRPVFVFSRET